MQVLADLNELCDKIWTLPPDEELLASLSKSIARLSAPVSLNRVLQVTAGLIKRGGVAQIQGAQGKVSKFIEVIFNDDSWSCRQLQSLEPDTFIFLALSFTGQEIVKIDDYQLMYLLTQSSAYLKEQKLPEGWLFGKEIQLAVASRSQLRSFSWFRKGRLV